MTPDTVRTPGSRWTETGKDEGDAVTPTTVKTRRIGTFPAGTSPPQKGHKADVASKTHKTTYAHLDTATRQDPRVRSGSAE